MSQITLLIFLLVILIVLATVFSLMSLSVIYGAFFSAPYVPSNPQTIKRLIAAADIKKNDKVYDLGCGDGRIVFLAADKGANAVGYEISHIVYLLAKVKQWFYKKKGTIIRKNIFKSDLSDADIIFCYLLPRSMPKLKKKFEKELKKGCKIVSHAFQIPEWNVVKHLPYDKQKRLGSVWVYENV